MEWRVRARTWERRTASLDLLGDLEVVREGSRRRIGVMRVIGCMTVGVKGWLLAALGGRRIEGYMYW